MDVNLVRLLLTIDNAILKLVIYLVLFICFEIQDSREAMICPFLSPTHPKNNNSTKKPSPSLNLTNTSAFNFYGCLRNHFSFVSPYLDTISWDFTDEKYLDMEVRDGFLCFVFVFCFDFFIFYFLADM